MAHKGYFVISDLTGYTAFLTGSELDHAQDILKSLFDTLLDAIKPPLLISNFQGDAILTYAPAESLDAKQILMDAVESIYCAFAKKRELMERQTTCTCKACANIHTLDLKLFVHYGEYVLQDMRGKAELSGPDVIIAHRMMKNTVKEATGYKAYTLFTAASIEAMGLQELTAEMKSHSESYEHIGEVGMYAYDLKAMWERRREEHRVVIHPDDTWIKAEGDLPAPPSTVWEYLVMPDKRFRIMDKTQVVGVTRTALKNGLITNGSLMHCAHGDGSMTNFQMLDYQPFEYFTELGYGMPMTLRAHQMFRLTPIPTGTRLMVYLTKPQAQNPFYKIVSRLIMPFLHQGFTKDYRNMLDKLRQVLLEDGAALPQSDPT